MYILDPRSRLPVLLSVVILLNLAMNKSNLELSKRLVPENYVQQAAQALSVTENKIRILLEQRRLPDEGWDEMTIEVLLQQLSLMDSNNFPGNCGAGEREARISSELVARRHFRMGHGIGRSGDINEVQPKAAGSSLMNKLTNTLLLQVLREAGAPSTASAFVVPMATGMSLVLCFLTLRHRRKGAKYVIWPRIDQKSCFKCMLTAGFEPVIVQNKIYGDELRTDIEAIEKSIEELKAENIVCVLTTTSCFAPRTPDRLEEVSKLCKQYNIPHLVNNAYGVQSSKCMHLIQEAAKVGRLDAYVQSSDKNFMVPVGGSIIAGFDKNLIEEIGKTYPGRASAAPSTDMFITLLNLGKKGYQKLLQQRKHRFNQLKQELTKVAEKHGERLLDTRHNPVSLGITLSSFRGLEGKSLTRIGSMLFTRCISGARVVASGDTKVIGGHTFHGWGSHCNEYPHAYLTAAAAIGMTENDVEGIVMKLDKVLTKVKQEYNQKGLLPEQKGIDLTKDVGSSELVDTSDSKS